MRGDVSGSPITRALAERLRSTRLRHGWTLKDLGDLLNVSYQQVSKFEAGENRLSIEQVRSVASAVGEDPSEWIGTALSMVPPEIRPITLADRRRRRLMQRLTLLSERQVIELEHYSDWMVERDRAERKLAAKRSL